PYKLVVYVIRTEKDGTELRYKILHGNQYRKATALVARTRRTVSAKSCVSLKQRTMKIKGALNLSAATCVEGGSLRSTNVRATALGIAMGVAREGQRQRKSDTESQRKWC